MKSSDMPLHNSMGLILLKYRPLISPPEGLIQAVVHGQQPDRDLVAAGCAGILQDPLFVVQDKADDLFALLFVVIGPQHLVERAEARVDAPAKDCLSEGRVGLNDLMAHLVGHFQKIELAGREAAVDDGVHVVHVVIF